MLCIEPSLRVRLFWVKMISGNHFHPFPHVWLSRKMIFSEKWLPVDQYFHLWPENHFLPSFSLQLTSEKREWEREKREPRSEREREKRAEHRVDDRTRRRAARSSFDCAIEELVAFLLLGFGFFCLIWCIFCKNIWMNQP